MQVHDIQCCQLRNRDHEQSRHDGKILGNIVRDTECSQCSAHHQQLFTDFNDFDELGRVVVEVYHISGLLGSLRTAVHGDTDVCLGQCGSVVRSVTHHGDQFAGFLLLLDIVHFIFRLGFGNVIVYTSFFSDIFCSQRVIACHHNGLDTHLAEAFETFLYSRLDNILQLNHTDDEIILRNDQRRPSVACNLFHQFGYFLRIFISGSLAHPADGIESSFADTRSVFQVDAGTFRFRRKFNHAGT